MSPAVPAEPPVLASSSKQEPTTTQTPTPVPPGLSLPQDFPPLAAPSAPPPAPSRAQLKTSSNAAIKPVVPVLPTSSTRLNVTPKDPSQGDMNRASEQSSKPSDSSKTENRVKVKGTKDASMEKKADAQAGTPPSSSTDIKDKSIQAVAKPLDKKQRPRKLDITAAKEDSKNTVGVEDTSTEAEQGAKSKVENSNVPEPSQPSTPATTISQISAVSAIPQNQARVARAPPVPKAEAASPGIISSKQASRRPSLASIPRPGTPTSEKLSDNLSFTSNTISRANSPPPNKVGSAPVRQMTKNQQKKERQARAKQAEGSTKAEEFPTKTEEIQAPIVGRKKKTKKEKSRGTADSTPTVTRPASPVLQEVVTVEKATPVPVTPVKEGKKGASKSVAEVKEPDTPSSPATPITGDHQKPLLTAASIFAQLTKAKEISAQAADVFKTMSPGLNHRPENIEPDFPELRRPSEEQICLLDQGEAIPIQKGPNNYLVVLPDYRSIPGFTAASASRYIELRKNILARGDVPCTDGWIPPPSPKDLTTFTALCERSSKPKKLINRFAAPTTQSGSSTHKYGVSSDGTAEESANGKKTTLSVAEAEQNFAANRKETEILEKRLANLVKKNRRLMFGNAH